MKKYFTLLEEANRRSIKKMTLLLVLFLCFGISTAWGAQSAILYVNASATAGGDGTSWVNAFNDLQSALDAAGSGDEIWVAAGAYTPSASFGNPSDPRTASFILKSGVNIYGGFAGDEKQRHKRQLDSGLTVLSGDIGIPGDDTDNSYHVVYAYGVTEAVLDGFTVTGGRGDDNSAGAGMYNINSALTVANCIFSNNKVAIVTVYGWATGRGGGMYNKNSAVIVTNSTFSANQAGNAASEKMGAGGGMYNEGYFSNGIDRQSPVITGCTFSDNVASSRGESQIGSEGGGGMHNYDCSPTIDSCTFTGNRARYGGAMINFLTEPTITNCIFSKNFTYRDGYGGAIGNIGSNAKILNDVFYENGFELSSIGVVPTYTGGAIWDRLSSSVIGNSLFMKNAAHGMGAAISFQNTIRNHEMIANCLFFENWSGDEKSSFEPMISHVLGEPDESIDNLYDIDPLMKDPAGGDFRLRYDSPCIDSGTTRKFLKMRWLPIPDKDFQGDNRFVDGDGDDVPAADIGVDEFIPNLPDLRAFLQDLADAGELDEAIVARLLKYVDDALAALDQDDEQTAIIILNQLTADIKASLGETEIAKLLASDVEMVIESI